MSKVVWSNLFVVLISGYVKDALRQQPIITHRLV
jgi:hypothetical protein